MSVEPASRHRYPRAAICADALRGALGLAICLGLVTVAGNGSPAGLLFAACAALFAIFLYRVACRSRYVVEMDLVQLCVFRTPQTASAATCLQWSDLTALDLDYFCTRRDGCGGWLQLRLRAGSRTVRLDSRLQGFEAVVERAVAAARCKRLALSATTAGNLLASGFETGLVSGGDGGGKMGGGESGQSEYEMTDICARGGSR